MRLSTIVFILLLTQGVPGPQPASVSGIVVRQGTDEPLSKATVILYPVSGDSSPISFLSATTDANGRFSVGNIPPGQYRISVTRTNYVRAEFGDRASNGCGTPVSLIAGQRFADARIAILPAGVISGHLFDSDREGVPNVSAHALKYVYDNGKAVLTVVQTVQTNDMGEFRLFGLTPGRYYVAAALETQGRALLGELLQEADVPFLNAPTATVVSSPIVFAEEPLKGDRFLPAYFPGGPDPSNARAIELRPGESVGGVDVTVTLSHPVRISGRVANSVSRETPRSLRLTLLTRLAHPNAGTPIRTTNVKPDGTFEMPDVLPGPYFLVAAGLDSSGRLTGRASVDVGETNLQNVVVEISRGFELEGRVSVDDPKVMERLMGISLMPANPAPGRTQPPNATIDQKNGSFKFQGITPGEYVPFVNFKAEGPLDFYVRVLRLGSQDVRDGIRLDSQPGALLEMVVGNHGAVVEGTVVNDKQEPVAGATVVLVPDIFLRKRASYYKTGRTDASGKFRLQAISPGEYKLFAWEEAETGAWQDPDFLRPYETRGKAITLREGITEQPQVSVIPSTGPLYGQCPGPFTGVR